MRIVSFSSVSSLIFLPRVSPLISGICISKTARLKGVPFALYCFSFASASLPLTASSKRHPRYLSCSFRTSRLVLSSSTISICFLLISLFSARTRSTACFCFVKGILNQNVEPSPSLLSTPISPFMIWTRFLDMARPKPVPPYLRVVEASTWEKDLNSTFILSCGMPMPVSFTLKRIFISESVSLSASSLIDISPLLVNFKALLIRFVSI